MRKFAIEIYILFFPILSGCVTTSENTKLVPTETINESRQNITTENTNPNDWQTFTQQSNVNTVPDLIYRRRWSDVLDSLPNTDYLDSLDKIFLAGYANFKLEYYAKAESIFAGLFTAPQYDLSDWVNYFLAKSAYENEDYNLAHQLANSIGKIPGYGDDIVHIKWHSLWNMGKKHSALVELDSLWKTGQIGKLDYLYQKAICLLDTGDTNSAKKNFKSIINSAIGKKKWRRYIVNSADKLTEIGESTQSDIELIAKAYYYSKNYNDAQNWLVKISNIDNKPRYRYFRAVSLYKIGRYSKASSEFKKMLKHKSYDRNTLWWRIALCERELGKIKSAQTSLDSALYKCKNSIIKVNSLKQRIFIAQKKNDWEIIAKYGKMLAQTDAGGNDGSIGLIWCILAYIIDEKPDNALSSIRKYRKHFTDKNFQDELSYWESKALLELHDTTASDSILKILAEQPRYNAFNWLARKDLQENMPDASNFIEFKPLDADSLYLSAKFAMREIYRNRLISLPEDALFSKAEHLAKLGLIDIARTSFAELGKKNNKNDSPALKLEMWRFYYTHRLYALASRKGASICSDFKNPPKEILRLEYITPFPELVQQECRIDSINPFFVYGTMIHESAHFDIYAFSYAGARGLMQFIPSTGKTVANWFGIKNFESSMLYDYALSIKFGARFLSELMNHRNSPIYTLAEYNAGDKPVDRWISSCPDTSDFILCTELIDYRQTRIYIKKILGNYWTYCWLYRDRIVEN